MAGTKRGGVNRREATFVWIGFGLVCLAAILLRVLHLGYSDFQGDEIKALPLLGEGQSLTDLLLAQRKPPMQWLVTSVTGWFDPDYKSHLVHRLPFAVAGSVAVLLFFLLVSQFFDRLVALFAAALLASNGILVAFGRIVQYQSFVILFAVGALLLLALSVRREAWRYWGLYGGLICLGLALLSHYDAFSVIPPAGLLLYRWSTQRSGGGRPRRDSRHLAAAVILAIGLVCLFYLPHLFSLTDHQIRYWEARMTGPASNSVTVFRFYNSGFALGFSLLFALAGLLGLRRDFRSAFVLVWLVPAVIFLEGFMASPRTHIYCYLLPLFILIGIGIRVTIDMAGRHLGRIAGIGVGLAASLGIVVMGLTSHALLVDHTPEYPWEEKTVLGFEAEGGLMAGTMGFPYRRDWQGIAEILKQAPNRDAARYATNEKSSIVDFYLEGSMRRQKAPDQPLPGVLYVILVDGPQSWDTNILGQPVGDWNALEGMARTRVNARVEIIEVPEAEAAILLGR